MHLTYTGNAKLDDGRAICIDYQVESHGCPSNGWDEPGEAPILHITSAWIDDDMGELVDLSEAEKNRIERELTEAFDPAQDDPFDDPDDWSDWDA